MSGIVIESNNSEKVIERKIEINQIICDSAWGEIIGDIGEQSDLIALFNTKENKNRTILDSDNFDEVTANGKYSASYGTIMLDVANAYGKVFQRVVYQANNTEKFRWQTGGEWNDWVKLADTDDLAKKMNVEPTVLPEGTDLGTVTDTGEYLTSDYVVKVSIIGSNIIQTITYDDGTTAYRYRTGGIWDDWHQFANTGDLSYKVDKEPGKGLSTNDYTTAEKTKLNTAVTSTTVAEIVTLTQSAYDALSPKATTTLYIITGA